MMIMTIGNHMYSSVGQNLRDIAKNCQCVLVYKDTIIKHTDAEV